MKPAPHSGYRELWNNLAWAVVVAFLLTMLGWTFAGKSWAAGQAKPKFPVRPIGDPPPPPPPTAADDAFSTPANQTLTVTAPGVLANDVDFNGNPMTVVQLSSPANGTLSLNADGSFTYVPALNYSGEVNFVYSVSDGTQWSNPATVTITIGSLVSGLDTGLVGRWKLDASGGTVAADSSGNGNDGTLFGGPTWHPTGQYMAGVLQFTVSTNQYVKVPASASMRPTQGVTISCWANPDYVANGNLELVRNMASGGNGFALHFSANDFKPQFEVKTSAGDYVAKETTSNFTTTYMKRWHHYCGTFDATTGLLKFYIDGSLRKSVQGAPGALSYSDDMFFMNYPGGSVLTGMLGEIREYSRVLSAAEIAVLGEQPTLVYDDDYFTWTNQTLTISSPGILHNDQEYNSNDPTTAVKLSDPANGTLALHGDGGFTYVPHPGFVGIDSFTYFATDGMLNSLPATVHIRVGTPGSDPSGYWKLDETTGTLAADSSGNGNDGTLISGPNWQPVGGVSKGCLKFASPPPSQTVRVHASPTVQPTQAVTVCCWLKVTQALDPASVDIVRCTDNGGLGFTLKWSSYDNKVRFAFNRTNNLGDYIPDTISNSTYLNQWHHFCATFEAITGASKLYVDGVQHQSSHTVPGNLNYNSEMYFMWSLGDSIPVPLPGFLDEVRIYSRALPAEEVLALVNLPPEAADDFYPVLPNQPLAIATPGVLGNDSDYNHDSISAVNVSAPAHGQVVLNADGSFVYTPNPGFQGQDSFSYKCNDGRQDSAPATVNLQVGGAPQTGLLAYYKLDESTDVYANDSSGNANTGSLLNGPIWEPSSGIIGGSLQFDGTDDLVSIPSALLAQRFTSTVTMWFRTSNPGGILGLQDTGASVTPANTAPLLYIGMDGKLRGQFSNGLIYPIESTEPVTDNAWHFVALKADNDTQSMYVDGRLAGTHLGLIHPINLNHSQLGGAFLPNTWPGGLTNWTFFNGQLDEVRIYDRALTEAELGMTAPEAPPVARGDLLFTPKDTPLNLPGPGVLANDSDINFDPLTVLKLSDPASGVLNLNSNGGLQFTPAPGFTGVVSFTYLATDGTLNSDPATVDIHVLELTSVSPTGTPLDSKVNLTLSGNGFPVWSGLAEGRYSVSCDGLQDCFSVHSSALVNGPQITVEAWVKDGIQLHKRNGSAYVWEQFELVSTEVGKIAWWVASGELRTPSNSVQSIGPGWTHVACTYDGNAQRIYLNGILDTETIFGRPIQPWSEDWFIYCEPHWGHTFTRGSMSEFRFWKKARSQAEIQNTMNAALVRGAQDLVVRYDFTETGPNLIDHTGNGHTGTAHAHPIFNGFQSFSHLLIRLKKDGQYVSAYGPLNASNDTITCSMDLQGQLPGIYDVELLCDGAVIATLPASFTIYGKPTAQDDSFQALSHTALVVPTPGVLTNDSEPFGLPLTAAKLTDPAHGTLAFNADGSFSYTSDGGYFGPDSFTYQASNGVLPSAGATVSIGVEPAQGVVAYYPLDESSGTVAGDASGNEHDGTLVNGPVWQPSSGGCNGALQFDGLNDYVNLGLADIPAPWTFSVLVKREDNTAFGNSILSHSAAGALLLEQFPNSGKVGVSRYGDNYNYTYNYAAPVGSWVQLTFVGLSSGTKLYVNGKYSETSTSGIALPISTLSYPNGAMKGLLDEVRIYNRALADNEILALLPQLPPIATDDSFGVAQDGNLHVPAPGLLANDTDPNQDALTAIQVSAPAHGLLTLNLDGSFTYTPDAGYQGTDSFTYMASGGADLSNLATVTLNVGSISAGLVGWWKLNDGTGVAAADSSGLGNNGTLINAPQWTTGLIGGALRLDGTSQDVEVPHSASITPQNWTLSAWVRPEISNIRQGVMEKYDFTPGTGGYLLRIEDTNRVRTSAVYEVGSVDAIGTSVLVPGRWYHLAATYDYVSGDLRLYVNGKLDASAQTAFVPLASTLPLKLGEQGHQPGKPFGGVLDEMRLYNRALSIGEIQALSARPPVAASDGYTTPMNTALDLPAPGLLGNDSGTGTLTALPVSNPVHGTLTLNPDGSLHYAPNAAYSGPDAFTYRVQDDFGLSAAATVFLNVGSSSLALTAPNGGEAWQVGSLRNIAWNSSGVSHVKVELSRDAGASWETLSASTPAAAGSFAWTVTGPTSADAYVRVSDADNGAPVDLSDARFQITNTFLVEVPFAATGFQEGKLAWCDYDNDGNLDVGTSGTIGMNGFLSISQTLLVHNQANGTFSVTYIGAADGSDSLARCTVAWGDYNNDGLIDVLVCGVDSLNFLRTYLYKNLGGGVFTKELNAVLPGREDAGVAWADIDNDGRLDLIITGRIQGSSDSSAQIFRNMGNGVFQDTGAALTGVLNASVAAGDYDNDGLLDLAICGLIESSNTRVTCVYHNNGNFDFTPAITTLAAVDRGKVAWGDYDNDGKLDLLVSGQLGPSNYITKLYHNNGNGTFTDSGNSFHGVYRTSAAWADFDNDGYLDLFLSGADTSNSFARLYHNNRDGTFSETGDRPLPVRDGDGEWGDYDNDGRLDLLITGRGPANELVAKLYRNITPVANTVPTAPSGLSASISNQDVTFTWNPASDDTTPASGLTYNLQVGLNGFNDVICAGEADLNSGQRRVVQMGNVQKHTSWTLHNLPSGVLHARVQTLDNSFAASPWSVETVVYLNAVDTPPVAVADALNTDQDSPLNVSAPGLLVNDSDPNGDPLTAVKVSNPSHGALVFHSSGAFEYTPDTGYYGNDTFMYKASDGTLFSNPVLVTIHVKAAVVAGNDSYTFYKNTPLSQTAPGVLSNDSDPNGGTVSAVLVTNPAHGVLTLDPSGALDFTPDTDFTGVDSFTYRAQSSSGDLSPPATVTLNYSTATFHVTAASFTPGATYAIPPGQITLTCSENIDPATVNAQNVQLVRAGPDGNLGTLDDVAIIPASITVVGTKQIVLDLTGATLPTDTYEVRLASQTGAAPQELSNLQGIALDGEMNAGFPSGDGQPGGDFAAAFTITIVPVANIAGTWPQVGAAPLSLNFDGSNSFESGDTIAAWNWDFGDGGSDTGATLSHTYTQVGDYTVSLTVTDSHGIASAPVTVSVSAWGTPVALIAGTWPQSGQVPLAFDFEGSGSSVSGGTITAYAWDFGDGQTATGPQPSHTYSNHGDYTVSLTVIDNHGQSSAPVTVDVSAWAAPVAKISASALSGLATLAVDFDGTGSNEPGGAIAAYAWDFGDGNTGTGATPSHSYTTPGNYTASLTVTDSHGLASAPVTVSVSAWGTPVAQIVGSWPQAGPAPFSVDFDGTPSTVANGTILNWSWDFGDGSSGSGSKPTHVFAPGTYTISLVVTDNHGTSSAPTTVQVTSIGTDPNNMVLQSGTFQINRTKLNADSLTLAGTVNTGGWPVNFANAKLTLSLNGSAVFGPVTLDANGRASALGASAYSVSVARNSGGFNIVLSGANLRTAIGLPNATASGKVPIDVKLTFSNGGFSTPISTKGTFDFDYQSVLNVSSSGRYNQKTSPPVTGYFQVTSASAVQSGVKASPRAEIFRRKAAGYSRQTVRSSWTWAARRLRCQSFRFESVERSRPTCRR